MAKLHARYSALVEVQPRGALGLTNYASPYGWKLSYLRGWKVDKVPVGDPARNALMYFQPEDDSIERLGLAILPVQELSAAGLMEKVQQDLNTYYEKVAILSQENVTHGGLPAVQMMFAGNATSHPQTKTQSLVIAFVRGGLGYVVSGRTAADRYASRRALIESMVKSFEVTGRTAAAGP
jgi:hypothetical protein